MDAAPKNCADANSGQPPKARAHGFAATVLLPSEGAPARIEERVSELTAEFRPTTFSAKQLVQEVARHSFFMEKIAQAEQDLLEGDTGALLAGIGTSPTNCPDPQAAIRFAVCSEQAERLMRYRRAHERGFYSGLLLLRTQQPACEERPASTAPVWPPPEFADESACQDYLANWQTGPGKLRCPCGAQNLRPIAGRPDLQCQVCRRHISMRSGTIFKNSRLSLRVWITTTLWLLRGCPVPLADLQELLGVSRRASLTKIVARIRGVLSNPHASNLLAGLPGHAAVGVRPVGLSVPENGTLYPTS